MFRIKHMLCKKCNQEEDFGFRNKEKTRLHSCCRKCMRNVRNNYEIENRTKRKLDRKKRFKVFRNEYYKWKFTYLKDKSCKCGEIDPIVLQFDHIIGDKEFNIGDITRKFKSCNWQNVLPKVLKEIEKCQILCSNCHLKKTTKEFISYRV